jgi:hypothetical protein
MFTKQMRELERQDTVVTYKNSTMDIRVKYENIAREHAANWNEVVSNHIIDVIISVMMHRDGVQTGGGFVTSVCDNDLVGAITRADDECIKHLKLITLARFCVRPRYGEVSSHIE